MAAYPLVTNAIPLYRSKPFVEIISANIDAIRYPNVEILISDRHQYDDALDILESRYAGDPRVRLIGAKDGLTYAEHYNLLLALGRGKYFRWMPHDDSYPRCCLEEKVEILEARPEVVLVNGPWHDIDSTGKCSPAVQPRKSRLGRWSYESSVFIAFGNYEAHAFKGLFRRSAAISRQVWLVDTARSIMPERCWEFAMSLIGEFCHYPQFAYYKRRYAGSTSYTWAQNRRMIDWFYSSLWKFRYQWSLDRKAIRIIAFLVLILPLTCRLILLNKTPTQWRRRIKAVPGRPLKRIIREILSRL